MLSAKSTRQTFKRNYIGQTSSEATASTSASDSGVKSSAASATGDYLPPLTISDASHDIQTRPAINESTQVPKSSVALEMFGDLRSMGHNYSREHHISLEEFTVHSAATLPVYLVQSRLNLENSPLSKVFTGFRDAARQMVATGTPVADIIEGTDVVIDLLLRDRRTTDGFTCSSWSCELWRTFGDLDDLARVGCVFLLARLMRVSSLYNIKDAVADSSEWMICPTPESYHQVPECIRPTPTQCFVPHMPAVDLHPMPAMRDMLCNRLQDWMTPIAEIGLSCNWPYTMDEALETVVATKRIRVSDNFGEHVSRSENWSLNSYALSLYPELAGNVRIEDA
jgi:hypothetical protein